MKVTGICLITNQVPVLTAFYQKVLGVSAEGNDVHVELKTDGVGMAIFSTEGMEQMAPGSMQGAGHGCFTVNFKVDDVDAEYEKIKTMAVEIIKMPQTHPWGSRSFWFRDPDRNIVNFYSEADETR
ncbi:VOC family protein [Paenibacillus puldeungensis]|uniref:VOC family protein n=1 Tax=Paenibacillus puldeungensis TaxID=696536 RepID=A0ABW3RZL9_9BACL